MASALFGITDRDYRCPYQVLQRAKFFIPPCDKYEASQPVLTTPGILSAAPLEQFIRLYAVIALPPITHQ
jgi:hypothetical protein